MPSRFPYQDVVGELRASIESGRLAPGERLPSENELAEQYEAMLPDSYRAAHRYDGAIIQRQRCEAPEPVALRPRDLAIVRDVWRYHFLTTEQLRELWWPARPPMTW